MEDIVWLL